MPLKNADSQIAFTSVASNTYAAIIVGRVEVELIWKHYISPLSMPLIAFTCPLQSEALMVFGQWKPTHGMWTTSPALKTRQQTVEADRSKPVAVLQRRLNTVDEAVRPVTAMWTRWQSSHAVITLSGPVPDRLCIWPSSLHWFHTCITVVAAFTVWTAMSQYDKSASQRPTILPLSNALTCLYCTLLRRWGKPALTLLVTQEMSLLGLCVCHLSGNVINYTGLHISQVWSRSNHSVWVVHLS